MNKKSVLNEICRLWIDSKKIPQDYKKYIFALSDSEVDRYFTHNKMTFGTAGIRATMGPGTNRINKFTYQQMAEGVAHWLNSTTDMPAVVIAHDNRKNAEHYSKVVAQVLTHFGIKVLFFPNNELKATPITSFVIRQLNLDGGIIITASHNPKNYLGFKVYNKTGGQILPEEADIIVKYMPENQTILNNEYVGDEQLIEYMDDSITNEYFAAARSCLIKTDPSVEKHFPVVFTAHHGTASKDLPEFLKTLGYIHVVKVEQQCVPDPEFTYSPNSNPEDKESFQLSLKYAASSQSEIMLAVDPDSDRLAVAVLHHDEWIYLTGNEMGIIFTHYVLKNKEFTRQPLIISTFVSTYYINKIAEEYNAEVIRTPTGFKWVGAVLENNSQNYDFVVGFEEAIGSLNSEIGRDKDGFQAAALALEIFNDCKHHDKTLVDYLEHIYDEFGGWAGETVAYLIQAPDWKEKMSIKMNELASFKKKYSDIIIVENKWNQQADALEWHLENGMWIKFRMSGTEPKFKVYYNIYAETSQEARQILNRYKAIIDDLLRQ